MHTMNELLNCRSPLPHARTHTDAGGVYESVTVAEHLQMPRVDPTTGEAVKLTSNILKDGSWVGVKPRARKMATR